MVRNVFYTPFYKLPAADGEMLGAPQCNPYMKGVKIAEINILSVFYKFGSWSWPKNSLFFHKRFL